MPWTERQHALLRAMGLRAWSEPVPAAADAAAADATPRPDAARADPAGAGTRSHAAADAASHPTPVAASDRSAAPPAVAAAAPGRSPVPRPPAAGLTAAAPPAPAAPAPGRSADEAAEADDGGRAARIATMDWPALREAVAACRACSLCESRRQTVFGTGSPRAHWMVVGEAPGEQEDKQGEPFVGPAGRLLDQMLAALDLTRAAADGDPADAGAAAGDPSDGNPADGARRVYIANTLKCRPPGNRNPTPQELAACEPFLQRQIALVRPRIILAMGRFAVQSLLRTPEAIGRLRGRVHRYEGVPLVVTYHPAYLLRNLPDKARAWQDLCLAAATVEATAEVTAGAAPGGGPASGAQT